VLEAVILVQILYFRRHDLRFQKGKKQRISDDNFLQDSAQFIPSLSENREFEESIEHGDVKFTLQTWILVLVMWLTCMSIGVCSFQGLLTHTIILEIFPWASIVLWSSEVFFQMFLNWKLDTCEGQSYIALFLVFVGKLSDFCVQCNLAMPGRHLLLAYFSTSAGFMNICQCLYMIFRVPSTKKYAKNLSFFAIVVLIGFVYGPMSYILIFGSFQVVSCDMPTDRWIHSPSPRFSLFFAPILLTATLVGTWIASKPKHARQPSFVC